MASKKTKKLKQPQQVRKRGEQASKFPLGLECAACYKELLFLSI